MAYAESLKKLIQCPTVTNSGKEYFEKFHAVLAEQFPLVHKNCEIFHIGGDALLYKMKGKSADRPIVLMAHQDVVPAVGGDWKFEPFSGTIEDGKIYGRGTMDCKNSLFYTSQAVEELIAEGFVPEHDIYLSYSDNEETSGLGVVYARDWFKSRGIVPALTVDEGGTILEKVFPGMLKPFAVIGIVEKGYADIKFVARSKGGHSSQPPKHTPIARLSQFVNYCETHKIFDRKMTPAVHDMLIELSTGLSGALKFVTKHINIFGGLVCKVLPKLTPMGGALFGTTMTFTMSGGAAAPNIIPQEAYVIANLRFAPGDEKSDCIEKLGEIAQKYDIEMEVLTARNASPLVDTKSAEYKYFVETMHQTFPEIGVAPYLMCGGTDCRTMQEICPVALRCTPCKLSQSQLESMHASNENVDIDTLEDGIKFYKNLIKNFK
ncbi:MAG: M20/M25/M40 family metallo-hydrolase [Clostridia bacterium]